jgi:hypothetical protein
VKKLDRKENNVIRTIGIEDSQGNIIAEQKQVLQICQIYIEELYDRATLPPGIEAQLRLINNNNRPENLNVEPEEVVDADHKGSHILCNEVEKAIKEMRDKKATGDVDVRVEALKLLGDDGISLLAYLINNMY